MSTPRLLVLRSLIPLAILAGTALAGPTGEAPVATPSRDIVTTAVEAGTFRTLARALEAAGMVETLRGAGPFTVFAPTDEAFGRLPAGTLESLLRPEQRERLRTVLAHHVVAGRVRSTDLLRATSASSLAGTPLALGLSVGPARVLAADVNCSNGVIHVIDEVLLPPTPPPSPRKAAGQKPGDLVRAAIGRGAPLFNRGHVAECARIYEEAAGEVLSLPRDAVSVVDRADLAAVLARPAKDPSARAWELRRSFDRLLSNESFEPLIEAPMPEGFPAPGPLGRVVEKTYPVYRAARAEGGRSSFWTLFRHIQQNEIAMTAPVEMTLDDGMEMERMAFLYERTAQGTAGSEGAVEVTDLPAMTVLSIAMRGDDDRTSVALAKAAIEERLAEGGWKRAGSWRRLGYNSPMVASARRTWELQLPVTR